MAEYTFYQEKPIPRAARGAYADAVAAFIAQSEDAVRVEIEGKKPSTTQQGLIKAAKSTGAPVKVKRQGDKVFLVKS